MRELIKKYENSPSFLLIVGLCSALFFSATFLINRSIALEGGHWYWSATLRFLYIILILGFGFIVFKGVDYFKDVIKEFISHFKFWTLSGSIGFGSFYGFLCFSADFSPAWVIATTWQVTIIASLFVLWAFGQKLSKSIWIYTFIIFMGISLVNFSHFDMSNLKLLLFGFLPVLVAAISYPLGNQLVWEAKNRRKNVGDISADILNNAFVKVFLLTLGSYPIWIILFFFFEVGLPSNGQMVSVASISILSGVIATTLFLYARNKANTSSKLLLVDSTQSGEVFFALIGEVIFLNAVFPNTLGIVGILITTGALIAIVKSK